MLAIFLSFRMGGAAAAWQAKISLGQWIRNASDCHRSCAGGTFTMG